MSRKTEPQSTAPKKKGNCPDCRGFGVGGMYQDRCLTCDGTGTEALPNNNGSDLAEPHVAIPSEQSIEEQLREILNPLADFANLTRDAENKHDAQEFTDTLAALQALVDKATREAVIAELDRLLDSRQPLAFGWEETIEMRIKELSNKEKQE